MGAEAVVRRGWRWEAERLTAGPSSNNAKRNTWAQSARREDKRITAALCQRDPLPVHPNPSTVLSPSARPQWDITRSNAGNTVRSAGCRFN